MKRAKHSTVPPQQEVQNEEPDLITIQEVKREARQVGRQMSTSKQERGTVKVIVIQ